MNAFLQAMQCRRSYYAITKESPVSKERIEELLKSALLHTPSSFNMQSARALLLFHEEHDALWALTKQALRKVSPPEKFLAAERKIDAFAAGFGTVLFYDDESVVKEYADKFSLYRENFPIWAQQANGTLQFAVWNLLELEGLGASLQHYNPLIDEAAAKHFEVPDSWRLVAQMPFGAPAASPEEKTFPPVDKRVRVLGK